jgi:MOSC domain-containing protein YiiM
LLCNSVQTYARLRELFPSVRTLAEVPSFAENMIIDGFCSQDVCIGDVFAIERDGTVVARLEVANPRRPCYKIKQRHTEAVRYHTATSGDAGWFFRVVEPGSLSVGDTIKLIERRWEAYTLPHVAMLCYKGCSLDYKILHWEGTEIELEELLEMKQLGMFRWKEQLQLYVKEREAREMKWKEKQEIQRVDQEQDAKAEQVECSEQPYAIDITEGDGKKKDCILC